MREAQASGYQCAFHALGDIALDRVMNILEEELGFLGILNPLRHRLIHAGVTSDALIGRMARLGLGVDVQPSFISSEHWWLPQVLPDEVLPYVYRFKSMVEQGILLAAGSDAPVEPVNPFPGIQAAVTRQDMDGKPDGGFLPEEKLSVADLLNSYTINGACQYSEEAVKGSLAPGKFADFVVLTDNPLLVEDDQIGAIEVLETYVGGQLVYDQHAYHGFSRGQELA